ncbi:unnamed protein product [Paramecium octaurelia]|uniref:Transmembrane protein n=1 Tax=Paramecium octaurelia TaxID=43137 RepID=A0A8S1SRQ3_PAROT|nr:unnamed protein product [Paramecium octaurelia]
MRQIYEFIVIHIVFYVVSVHIDLKQQEFNPKDIYQMWMLFNIFFASIYIITKKLTLILVFLLQSYMYFYLSKYNPYYVQVATVLIPIALIEKSNLFIILNQIGAFLISGPYNHNQQILFVVLIIALAIYIYAKQHVEEILTKKKQKVDQDEKFLQELPFPLFIVNIKSQIHWSNKMARELTANCGVKLGGSLKEIFQDQDLFLQYLNQDSKQLIVQMNTVLIQQSLEQSLIMQQNKNQPQQQQQQQTAQIITENKLAKFQSQKEDNLQKSIHKYLNVACLTLNSLKITEQIQKEILTVLIKPFKINQMRLFMICINANKTFQQNKVLQNHLIQQIKQNGQQMLVSLQQDFQKWDNMRSLEIIRESDLKVISQSIVDLYKIIFEFETYEVSTSFFPQSNLINFQFKGLVTYLIEVFAGRYLQKFTSINLYFDNSIQDKMKGNSTNFSLIFMSILELIAKYSGDKKPSLKINCNLDQVTDQNKAYQIQLQFLWRQDDELDQIFKEFFHQQVMPMNVDPQVQRYLMTIKKLQSYSAMKIFYIEQSVESIELLSELHIFVDFYISDSEESNQQVYQPPQLQITFSREFVGQNPNEIMWQPKKQPQVIVDKNHQAIIRPIKPMPPTFFNKQNLPINVDAKQPKKQDETVEDEVAIQKKQKVIRELIQAQFTKVAPRLSEKIAYLIKKKLESQANKFQDIQFVGDHEDKLDREDYYQGNEEQSDCGTSEGKGNSYDDEGQSQTTPNLDSVPTNRRFMNVPFQNEFSNIDSRATNQMLQGSDLSIITYKRLKIDQIIEEIKSNQIDTADFSQITMNEHFIQKIADALEKNNSLKTLKFVKCDLSDQILIKILDSITKTQIESLHLQYNLLQEKGLNHLISLKQSLKEYPVKELHFHSNLVKEIQISKEKAQLSNLGIKVLIG